MALENMMDVASWIGFGVAVTIGGTWIASGLYGICREYKEMKEIKQMFTRARIKDAIMKERGNIIAENKYHEVGLN